MGVFAGPTSSWWNLTGGTDTLRSNIATTQIVQSGLVLNLDAGVSSSYPGSGTTWSNLSGLGNTATLTNGPTYSSSNGGSIVFDGTNDYASISSPSPLIASTFTFECWVNFTSITGDFGGIYKAASLFAGGTGGGSNQPELFVLSANNSSFTPNTVVFGGGGGAGSGSCNVSVASIIQNGTWCQIVLSKTSSNSQIIYVNGSQIGTGNHSHTFADGQTDFGGLHGTPPYASYLNGRISNIKVYNRALAAAEIQQNYISSKSRYGL